MDPLNQMPYPSKNSNTNSFGGMIAIIIIIVLLLLGGIYFFKSNALILSPSSNNATTTKATSTDAELLRIESELNSLDKQDSNESEQVDAEFQATSSSR